MTLGCAALMLAGCGEGMTWKDKLEALRTTAERGADTHYVLLTKNKKPTKERCNENYEVAMGSDTPPGEYWGGGSSPEWRELHLEYFVDSCVAGEPRQPKTRPKSTPPTTPSTERSTSNTDS